MFWNVRLKTECIFDRNFDRKWAQKGMEKVWKTVFSHLTFKAQNAILFLQINLSFWLICGVSHIFQHALVPLYGPAQAGPGVGYGPEGQGFESLTACQQIPDFLWKSGIFITFSAILVWVKLPDPHFDPHGEMFGNDWIGNCGILQRFLRISKTFFNNFMSQTPPLRWWRRDPTWLCDANFERSATLSWDHRSDLPTGNFTPSIPARLRGEVIRSWVNDDCFADDLANRKAVRQENLKRIAMVREQRH